MSTRNYDSHSAALGESWEEKWTSSPLLFNDDPLAPLEYLDVHTRRVYDEPEKKLLSALLRDAVFCFQHYLNARKGSRRKLHSSAAQWIFDKESDDVYSFNSVCEHLGVEPDYLRRGLRRWKQQQLDLIAPSAAAAPNGAAGPTLEPENRAQ